MTETLGSGGQVEVYSISVNEVVHKSFELCSANFEEELLDFEFLDEENYLLSYLPSELDFYDSKCRNILRRSGGKKLSLKAKGMSVVSQTSRFANGQFANVLGRFANARQSVRKRLIVSSQTSCYAYSVLF